jgi:hypothetical protein
MRFQMLTDQWFRFGCEGEIIGWDSDISGFIALLEG